MRMKMLTINCCILFRRQKIIPLSKHSFSFIFINPCVVVLEYLLLIISIIIYYLMEWQFFFIKRKMSPRESHIQVAGLSRSQFLCAAHSNDLSPRFKEKFDTSISQYFNKNMFP